MARQKVGLYSSTENDIVISILIRDYNKTGISSLFKRHEETIISSLYANKSIHNNDTYQKPIECHPQNPVEFMEAYYTSTKEIENLKDLLSLSMELYYFITKILLFKDLIYRTFCYLLKLEEGTNIEDINSFITKRFSYLDKYLYYLRLGCN